MVDPDMTFQPSGSDSGGEDDLDESPSEDESLDDTQTKITRFLPPAKKTRNTPERAELAKLCNPEGSPIYSVTGTSSVTPTVVTTPENDHSVETGEPGEPPDDIPWRANYRHRYVDAWGTDQLLDFLEQECGQHKLARGLREMKSTLQGQQACDCLIRSPSSRRRCCQHLSALHVRLRHCSPLLVIA